MLSAKKVVKLLRQDADAFRRDLEKLNSPQELHRQFEPDDEMFSAEDVEELLREDARTYMKQFKKTPQELRQCLDRMIEQLEREGPDGDDLM